MSDSLTGEALKAQFRLHAFVIKHATGGGCRMLSQGDGCECPRCDLDRLVQAAQREARLTLAITALRDRLRDDAETLRRNASKRRKRGDLTAIGGPSDAENNSAADDLSDRALSHDDFATELTLLLANHANSDPLSTPDVGSKEP